MCQFHSCQYTRVGAHICHICMSSSTSTGVPDRCNVGQRRQRLVDRTELGNPTDVRIIIRFVLYAPGVERLQPHVHTSIVPVMRMYAMVELDREGWDVCLCSISHRLFLFLWCSSVRRRMLALTLNPFLLCRMSFRYPSSTSCLTYRGISFRGVYPGEYGWVNRYGREFL